MKGLFARICVPGDSRGHTADAAAESPHRAMSSEVPGLREAAISANAEALTIEGRSYVGASAAVADT
ncbi:hypothetical protein [Streptomyces sp. NPDC002209]|uniref:hypothetical protein n=1 Tax=Streptomyces sp. NPDC002209 TaxID=3364638 RepID=UPI0036A3D631